MIWKQGRKLCLLGVLAALSIFASGCFGGGKEKYTFRENGIDLLEAGDYEGAIQAFDQALEESLCMQEGLYQKMAAQGWYPSEQAQQQQIDKVRGKFANA